MSRLTFMILILLSMSFIMSCESSDKNDNTTDGDISEQDKEDVESEIEKEAEIQKKITYINCDEEVDLDAVSKRQFTMAPYLTNATEDGVSIKWEAKDNDPSYLVYWLNEDEKFCVCVDQSKRVQVLADEFEETHNHWLFYYDLKGLKPGTTYNYTLQNAEVPIPDEMTPFTGEMKFEPFGNSTLKTAPKKGEKFSMVIIGDNQGIPAQHMMVVDTIKRNPADMLLHLGDIVHDGYIRQYRYVYLNIQTPVIRNIPHFHVAGNHEQTGNIIPFDSILPLMHTARNPKVDGVHLSLTPRTGYGDYAHLRMIMLDTEEDLTAGSDQVAYLDYILEDTVKNHPEIIFIFVNFHRPTFSTASSRIDDAKVPVHEVVKRWKVDAVFMGHNHCYERFLQDGITYVVSGGAGAGLTAINTEPPQEGDNLIIAEKELHILRGEVTDKKIDFTVIRADEDSEIERFSLKAIDRSDLRL